MPHSSAVYQYPLVGLAVYSPNTFRFGPVLFSDDRRQGIKICYSYSQEVFVRTLRPTGRVFSRLYFTAVVNVDGRAVRTTEPVCRVVKLRSCVASSILAAVAWRTNVDAAFSSRMQAKKYVAMYCAEKLPAGIWPFSLAVVIF
eukprot:scaffold222_cov175-Amphora_coffeaeformis.AAC.14